MTTPNTPTGSTEGITKEVMEADLKLFGIPYDEHQNDGGFECAMCFEVVSVKPDDTFEVGDICHDCAQKLSAHARICIPRYIAYAQSLAARVDELERRNTDLVDTMAACYEALYGEHPATAESVVPGKMSDEIRKLKARVKELEGIIRQIVTEAAYEWAKGEIERKNAALDLPETSDISLPYTAEGKPCPMGNCRPGLFVWKGELFVQPRAVDGFSVLVENGKSAIILNSDIVQPVRLAPVVKESFTTEGGDVRAMREEIDNLKRSLTIAMAKSRSDRNNRLLFQTQRDQIGTDNDLLRDALKFYADPRTYEEAGPQDGDINWCAPIESDCGEIATKAIKVSPDALAAYLSKPIDTLTKDEKVQRVAEAERKVLTAIMRWKRLADTEEKIRIACGATLVWNTYVTPALQALLALNAPQGAAEDTGGAA